MQCHSPVRSGIYAVPHPCQIRYLCSATSLSDQVFIQCHSPDRSGIYAVPQPRQVRYLCSATSLSGQVFIWWHSPVRWGIYAVPQLCEVRYSCGATDGCTNFPITWEPRQNCRCQMGDMKQVPQWGPTNIMHNHIKFSWLGDLALWFLNVWCHSPSGQVLLQY
jgi:hypothetical protein